jgi:hypothetical protein
MTPLAQPTNSYRWGRALQSSASAAFALDQAAGAGSSATHASQSLSIMASESALPLPALQRLDMLPTSDDTSESDVKTPKAKRPVHEVALAVPTPRAPTPVASDLINSMVFPEDADEEREKVKLGELDVQSLGSEGGSLSSTPLAQRSPVKLSSRPPIHRQQANSKFKKRGAPKPAPVSTPGSSTGTTSTDSSPASQVVQRGKKGFRFTHKVGLHPTYEATAQPAASAAKSRSASKPSPAKKVQEKQTPVVKEFSRLESTLERHIFSSDGKPITDQDEIRRRTALTPKNPISRPSSSAYSRARGSSQSAAKVSRAVRSVSKDDSSDDETPHAAAGHVGAGRPTAISRMGPAPFGRAPAKSAHQGLPRQFQRFLDLKAKEPEKLTSLLSLAKGNFETLPAVMQAKIKQVAPSYAHLTLKGEVTNQFLNTLAEHFSHLESLHLENVTYTAFEESSLAEFITLRTLTVTSSINFLRSLARNAFVQLNHLSIENCEEDFFGQLPDKISQWKTLEELSFSSCSITTDNIRELLAKESGVKLIHLVDCDNVSEEIAESASKLGVTITFKQSLESSQNLESITESPKAAPRRTGPLSVPVPQSLSAVAADTLAASLATAAPRSRQAASSAVSISNPLETDPDESLRVIEEGVSEVRFDDASVHAMSQSGAASAATTRSRRSASQFSNLSALSIPSLSGAGSSGAGTMSEAELIRQLIATSQLQTQLLQQLLIRKSGSGPSSTPQSLPSPFPELRSLSGLSQSQEAQQERPLTAGSSRTSTSSQETVVAESKRGHQADMTLSGLTGRLSQLSLGSKGSAASGKSSLVKLSSTTKFLNRADLVAQLFQQFKQDFDSIPPAIYKKVQVAAATIERLDMSGISLTEKNVQRLVTDFGKLKTLIVKDAIIQRGVLKELKGLTSLKELNLSGAQGFDNQAAKDLASTSLRGQLETIDCSRTAVQDAGIKQIAAFNILKTLTMKNCDVTVSLLDKMTPSKSLKALDVSGCANLTQAKVTSAQSRLKSVTITFKS